MGNAASLLALTAKFLEREGAAIESIEPFGLEVLAPTHVQDLLGLPELGRLGFGPDLPAGAQRVSIESDLVDGLLCMLGERGRRTRIVVTADNPRPRSPERLLNDALVLGNATYRLQAIESAWTTYVIPTFRYVARSDDQREGLVSFAINATTGSLVDEIDYLVEAARAAHAPDGGASPHTDSLSPEGLADIASRALPGRIEARLGPFLRGMERRLQRDAARLHDYYGRLRGESLAKLDRRAARGEGPNDSEAGRREALRLTAIVREHAAKLEDLQQRFALVVEVHWVQTLEVVIPVQRFTFELRRRKSTRSMKLDADALARRLEPLACEYRYVTERLRLVCDDALHLVSKEGFAPCGACNKPSCHVCHPARCARCGHPR